MRPALSILFFTTLSGAGYGLWMLLGLVLAFGSPVGSSPRTALVLLAAGFALTTLGLLASVSHLGQPQRAWRAMSQWRSSWLSREGIAALLCVVVAVGVAATLVLAMPPGIARFGGGLLAVCAGLVVFCTVRIYTSLPTIAAWHNRYVLPVYLTLALASGGVWAWTLATLVGDDGVARVFTSMPALLALALVFGIALACKQVYWRHIDRGHAGPSIASATGLGRHGTVRSFEHPHTQTNYLTHEMGFVLARKHARRLRTVVLGLTFAMPIALLLVAALVPAGSVVAAPLALVAAMSGVFVERWLFFAEARHVVMLYYGARDA